MRLQFFTRLGNALGELAQDELATLLSLQQCLLQNLIAQAIHLDIHLSSSDTIAGTSHFEVHVAQVILITQNI